ncbi:MAG: class I SAM-dependent methyltransferase, partial [Micavibrio aeruginosavorus]
SVFSVFNLISYIWLTIYFNCIFWLKYSILEISLTFVWESMGRSILTSLKSGHRKAIGLAKDSVAPPQQASEASKRAIRAKFKDERLKLLENVPSHIIKKAWFTMSHMLLDDGAHVIDAGCNDGSMTYAISSLFPNIKVTGIDLDGQTLATAENSYQRDNLDYRRANLFESFAPAGSVDAIINSFVLHEVYSESLYNERLISKLLERQYEALKDNGYILIRDYVLPSSGEYVLIELKDKGSSSDDIEKMSEADFLIWYSEHARSKSETDGAGFFIEELPPNYPGTKLFRLPIKWAYEFILRKDDRVKLQQTLSKEYAFYTEREFRREMASLGARVVYTAPHWDEGFIKTRYDGKIRMYREDGTPMGPPPTSYIIVAQKVAEKTSQILQERRTSRGKTGKIHLQSVRDEKTGEIVDIASRDMEIAEIIPYRVTPEGQLKIYLHEALPRGLVNSVPRIGKNLDGRKWSGHMTEAMAMPLENIRGYVDHPINEFQKFAIKEIGVKPSLDASLQKGPGFFPDPYRIDERIETWYYRVEDHHQTFEPKNVLYDIEGFSSKGQIREFDAQAIMNAITVGYLPSSRLEPQLLALHQMLKIPTEVWEDLPIHLSEVPAEEVEDISKIVKQMTLNDNRFKNIKGSAGNIRLVQSVFVDEGRDQGGGMTNLAARDMEFIFQEDNTVNTAVVLPLVKDLQGEVLAGIVSEYLPVPQRYKGNGLTQTLPSFTLPKEITDIDAARRYIADKFMVDAKFVARMGESYYTHVGMTPHRIYPFVVTNMKKAFNGRYQGVTGLYPLYNLWKMLYWDNSESFIASTARTYKNLCQDSTLSVRWDFDVKLAGSEMSNRIMNSEMSMGSEHAPSSNGSGAVIIPPFGPEALNAEDQPDASKDGKSGRGDKGKLSGTSGFGGPNDDVMGGDFKATNLRDGPSLGSLPAPRAK